MKPLLSLCMIVQNKEKFLARSLNSVKGIVDEIIIVDTGSTDKTRKIANRFTKNVYEFEWKGSNVDPQNFARSKATGEWILEMSAEEFLDFDNLREAIDSIKSKNDNYTAYNVKTYQITGELCENVVCHTDIKLYKNVSLLSLNESEREQNIGFSNLVLFSSEHLYQTIEEQEQEDNELNDTLGFKSIILGNEYYLQSNFSQALEAFLISYKTKLKNYWVMLNILQIINCLIKLERYQDALTVILDAEKIYFYLAEFRCIKANIYLSQYRLDDAKEVLNEILNDQKKKLEFADNHFYDYIPHKMLASIYELNKNSNNAFYHSLKALKINNDCKKSLHILIKSYIEINGNNSLIAFLGKQDISKNEHDIYNVINILLTLNEIELALFYIDKIQELLEMKKVFLAKIGCLQNVEEPIKDSFQTISVEHINKLIDEGVIDFYDLITFSLVLNQRDLYDVIYNLALEERQKKLIDFLLNPSNETVSEQEQFIQLMERSIQFKKFNLFEKLVQKSNFFEKNINLEIGHLLFHYGFPELAIAFYQELELSNYDNQAYVNIISEFFKRDEPKDLLYFAYSAIEKNNLDFRIFKYAIETLILISEDNDVNQLISIALQYYPDSSYLKNIKIDSNDSFPSGYDKHNHFNEESEKQAQELTTNKVNNISNNYQAVKPENVTLGENVLFYQSVIFNGQGKVTIGNNVEFGFPYSPHYYGFHELICAEQPSAVISIGEGTSLSNDVAIRSLERIEIGNNCLIGDRVTIYDSDFHEINPFHRKRSPGPIKPVKIGNNVWVGSQVTILKGVSVGENSIIGTGSIVTKDIPNNCIVAGNPAKIIKENIDNVYRDESKGIYL